MPMVRMCPHCKMTRIWSSYQLYHHVINMHKDKVLVHIDTENMHKKVPDNKNMHNKNMHNKSP